LTFASPDGAIARPLPFLYAERKTDGRDGSMYEMVKRRGNITTKLANSPTFNKLELAQVWADNYMDAHSDEFMRGLDSIEARRIPEA
jgi:hypothetical protein